MVPPCMCCRRLASSTLKLNLKLRNTINPGSFLSRHGNVTSAGAVLHKSFEERAWPLCVGGFLKMAADESQQIKKFALYYAKERQNAIEKAIKEAAKSSGGRDNESSEKKGSKDGKDKNESAKRMMKYTFLAFGATVTIVTGVLIYDWGTPQKDESGKLIKDEFSEMPFWKAYVLRTYKEMRFYNKMIKDPSREKLLPAPLTDPYYQPPYTLVLEMTGVLVHPDWTYQTGWRFKKRPGVEFFLQQVATPLYEIVIYTSEQGFTAFPIIDILDPHGYVMYRLFRDATRYLEGHHVKDLSCLNRDLSKVIYLDWNDKSFRLQPENAFKLKKWAGEDGDKMLYELAIFLRTIATSGVDDVRPVLQFYNQFDNPLEAFKENQKRLQEEQQKKLMDSDKTSFTSAWSGGLFKRQ